MAVVKKTAAKPAVKSPAAKKAPARAKSTAKSAATAAKVLPPTWQAPADFKPFFAEITVKTEKDGLLSPDIEVIRYTGRYDRNCDERKKFDMMQYDPRSVLGVLSRLSMVTFVTNAQKRLPAQKRYRIVMRVSKSAAKGDIIHITFKSVEIVRRLKSGKEKCEVLDRTHPDFRKFRKVTRFMAPAFSQVLLPPARTRKSNKAEE